MEMKIKRVGHGEGLAMPAYESAGAAGMDLIAATTDDLIIAPGDRALVPAGIAIELPEGYEAQVRPRSGLALKKGVTVLNAPGTVDSDYRGELGIILINHGKEPYVVRRGERIAQLVIAATVRAKPVETEELTATTRGSGGYGSTGKKSKAS
jgi:dUTP pyrophosphatase